MASTPAGRAISWLHSLCVVRMRRQVLCRFEVNGLVFGGAGELGTSKINWELFTGENGSLSSCDVVSSGGCKDKRKYYLGPIQSKSFNE